MSAVLADTGPLYAASVATDQHHLQARIEVEELRRLGFEVVVIYPILVETYNLLVRRVPLPTAHSWLTGMFAVSSPSTQPKLTISVPPISSAALATSRSP